MSTINYKIVLLGNSGVGKTSIFKKLDTGEFHEKNIATIGIEKKTIDVNVEVEKNGKKEKKSFSISLFDTAGQEKFRAITLSYYKGSNGILLLYDITSKQSFENVSTWVDSIKDSVDSEESKYAVILIGNKLDLVNEGKKDREVSEEEAKKACKKFDLIWGGEQSTKDIDFDELKQLFGEYITEVYYKVGEKKEGKQKAQKIGDYKKKKKSCFGLF